MTDIHSCSYYCDRPECIKRQRDELRADPVKPVRRKGRIGTKGKRAARKLVPLKGFEPPTY